MQHDSIRVWFLLIFAELTGISTRTDFKSNRTEEVIGHWGSVKNFDLFIQKVKDDESEIAKLAILQFGSLEKYTEAMKYNLGHFSEIMEKSLPEEAKDIARQADMLYGKLTADLSEDVSTPEIQSIVHELLQFMQKNSTGVSLGMPCTDMLISLYYSENNVL